MVNGRYENGWNVTDSPNPNRTPTGYIFHGRSTKVTTGPISFIMSVFWCEPSSSTSSEVPSTVLVSSLCRSASRFLIYDERLDRIRAEKSIPNTRLPGGVSAEF